jgi:hypothetical protein
MWLLDQVTENDPLNGGYGYLEFSTYQNGYHEGVDFNSGVGAWADEGANLLAIGRQVLRYHQTGTKGFGNHAWWELLDGPFAGAYIHYAHASSFVFETVGAEVLRGSVIGACGHTGTTLPHLHAVVTKCQPPTWYWYGAPNVPRAAVEALTHNPITVCVAYANWAASGSQSQIAGDSDMTPELTAIKEALETSSYPASEVPALIAACSVWSANSESLGKWIAEIGALKEQVEALQSELATLMKNASAPK